jgi:hypothetical protein
LAAIQTRNPDQTIDKATPKASQQISERPAGFLGLLSRYVQGFKLSAYQRLSHGLASIAAAGLSQTNLMSIALANSGELFAFGHDSE